MGVFLTLLFACGCAKKSEPPKPEPAPSSSAASAISVASAEPALERKAPILEYRLVQELPAGARIFPLTNGVVMCFDCGIGDKPKNERKLLTFDGKEVKELAGLLSDKKISAALGTSITQELKELKGGDYRFTGTLPGPLYVEAYGQDYEDDNARDGTATISHFFVKRGATWEQEQPDESLYPSTHPPSWNAYAEPRGLPRVHDDAMLHAEHVTGWTLSGGNAPLLLAYDGKLDSWDGKAWSSTAAPWVNVRVARRLTDGRSFVLSRTLGLFAISAGGDVERVDISSQRRDFELLLIQDQPWLATDRGLYVPVEAQIKVAPLPVREPKVPRPKPPAVSASAAPEAASAAPSASAPPDGSTSAPPPPGIPAAVGFSASCKTPFVALFTPPQPHWSYAEAARNLAGAAAWQDSLWFAEYTRKGVTYFGAQAADEATARALMAAYVAAVPLAKPILSCLDLKAYLPDAYQPKWDAERVLINLRAGQLL